MLNAILPNRLQSAAFQNVNTWRGFTIADVNPRSNVELAQELSPTVQWTTFWSRATRDQAEAWRAPLRIDLAFRNDF